MEIIRKFSIGDKVWLVDSNHITESEIFGIVRIDKEIAWQGKVLRPGLCYLLDGPSRMTEPNGWYHEERLFPSREELIIYLSKQ